MEGAAKEAGVEMTISQMDVTNVVKDAGATKCCAVLLALFKAFKGEELKKAVRKEVSAFRGKGGDDTQFPAASCKKIQEASKGG